MLTISWGCLLDHNLWRYDCREIHSETEGRLIFMIKRTATGEYFFIWGAQKSQVYTTCRETKVTNDRQRQFLHSKKEYNGPDLGQCGSPRHNWLGDRIHHDLECWDNWRSLQGQSGILHTLEHTEQVKRHKTCYTECRKNTFNNTHNIFIIPIACVHHINWTSQCCVSYYVSYSFDYSCVV